jgi:hypothetical protein
MSEERAPSAALEAALDYRARGWRVVPVAHGEKRPVGSGWQNLRLEEDDIRREFAVSRNVGVLLGKASGGLVDVDLDVSEAAVVAGRLLPATARFGHAGKPCSHYLYRVRGEVKTRKFLAPDRTVLLELRSDGAQTVFPPSVHVSGEQIAWEDQREPVEIEALELERLTALVAAITLLARAWPAAGARHDASLALSGGLLRTMDVTTAEMFMQAVCAAAGDEEVESRIKDLRSTAERIAAGKNVFGWTKAGEILGKAVVKRVREWLREAHDDCHGDAEPGLAQITVNNRQLRDVSDEIVAVLAKTNEPPRLLVRGGQLVRIREDENGQPLIELLDEARLLGIANRVADFVTVNNEGGVRAASATHQVLRDVLVRGEWPYPPLIGLTECPVVRPDGGIVTTPGYEPGTRLVYIAQEGCVVPPVAAQPGPDEVAAAVGLIDELLCDFPFDSDASRANAIALLLEPLLRPAIAGPVPLALIDAISFGTGKSLLCEVLALLATGHPAAMSTAPGSEDEMRKRITAMLLAGTVFVFIDNVVGHLRSESLAAAITSTTWKDRLLGRTEMLELPQRAIWVATGNNLQVRGDLPRRCFWIRLDAKVTRPWLRDGFRHENLTGWVAEHRGRLLHALLTLCRAWWAAGCPPAETRPLGTFERWTSVTAGVLEHAGIAGFLGNLERMYEEVDAEADQWEGFLEAWRETFAEAVTTAEVRRKLDYSGNALAQAAPDDVITALDGFASGAVVRLSKVFTARLGQRFGPENLRLERATGDRRKKLARWRVGGDGPAGGAGVAGIDEPLF